MSYKSRAPWTRYIDALAKDLVGPFGQQQQSLDMLMPINEKMEARTDHSKMTILYIKKSLRATGLGLAYLAATNFSIIMIGPGGISRF